MSVQVPEDLAWLAEECEYRAQVREPGFTLREVIPAATSIYDPMPGYEDDDGSFVFCDIGGQREPGFDPRQGHGSIWRIHPDDRVEAVVPPGEIGKGQVMFPMRAPEWFGRYAGAPFFLGQMKPGRVGALWTHAVYWVPPGWETPEVFVTIPDSGTIGDGIPGALCVTMWAEPDTPEAGCLFVHSLMNCTIYKVAPDRSVAPWLVCDTSSIGRQFMPLRMLRGPADWGDLAGELLVLGQPDSTFEDPRGQAFGEMLALYRISDDSTARRVEPVELPAGVDSSSLRSVVAPPGFGPFAGQRLVFRTAPLESNMTATGKDELSRVWAPDGPLPWNGSVVSIDADNNETVLVSQLQKTFLAVQGDRLLLFGNRKSYSTGEFHYPAGSLYELRYAG